MEIETSKERYRELCREEHSIPLFSRDWWLDANCGTEGWDVVIAQEGGQISACLPFLLKMRFGQAYLLMPPGTPWLGPWIRAIPRQKYATELSRDHRLLFQLIDQLPPRCFFRQHFASERTNWLPFYWRDFHQSTRFTYAIDLCQEMSSIFREFKSNARGKVRKAEKTVTVSETTNLERFRQLLELTFRRQGLKNPFSQEQLRRIDHALDEHSARRIFVATDAGGRDHSALYLIWDDRSAYVHMVGEDPSLRSSGAGILLVWEAIRFAKEELQLPRFDFEGSMIEAVESVRRELGARQIPYHAIWRDDRAWWNRLPLAVSESSQRLARRGRRLLSLGSRGGEGSIDA